MGELERPARFLEDKGWSEIRRIWMLKRKRKKEALQ